MKKYEGKSVRKVKTSTGKIPDNVGMPSGKVSGGGYIRSLTAQETEAQKKVGAFVVINGKIFDGTFPKHTSKKFNVYLEGKKGMCNFVGTAIGESEEAIRKVCESRGEGRYIVIEKK